MSAKPNPPVRVAGTATPSGEPCIGREVEREEAPAFNDQERVMVSVDVDGTRLRARADEVEEL